MTSNTEKSKGFVNIRYELLSYEGLDITAKVIAALINELHANTGKVFISNQGLADKLAMKKSGVEKAIRRLRDEDLISSTITYKKGSKEVDQRILAPTSKLASICLGYAVKVDTPPSLEGYTLPPLKEVPPSLEGGDISKLISKTISKTLKDSYVQTDVCTDEEKQVNQEKQDETEQEVNPVNDQPKLVNNELLPTNQVKRSEVQKQVSNCSADLNENHFDKDAAFEAIWNAYPTRNGAKGSKANTKRLCETIAKTREDWEALYRNVVQYKIWASNEGLVGTNKVMMISTYFGKQNQAYREDWKKINESADHYRKNQLAITGCSVQTPSKSHNAMTGFASFVSGGNERDIKGEIV